MASSNSKEYEDISDFQVLPSTKTAHPTVFSEYNDHLTGVTVSLDSIITTALRAHYPSHTLTIIPASNCDLINYAAAGYAHAELDTSENEIERWRYYLPSNNLNGEGQLADAVFFGKYKFVWMQLEFVVYSMTGTNYILFPPDDDEEVIGHSKAVDALIKAVGSIQFKVEKGVLVWDGFWSVSHKLWQEVQKASWDDVILDKEMKQTLTKTVVKFFDSEKDYLELGVPWKRGLIFYGPAGNGKTISLKALMHDLSIHRPEPIISLYVKSLTSTFAVRAVFEVARQFTPCLLILEDIDALVTYNLQSYFFNEVDGLEDNNGILMIATTNHLDRLDGGLANRPSRFDRKYEFGLPDEHERFLYARYWQARLKEKRVKVDFPGELCGAFAAITDGFSFAYMKEAFVASLLQLARNKEDDDEGGEAITEHKINCLRASDVPTPQEYSDQDFALRHRLERLGFNMAGYNDRMASWKDFADRGGEDGDKDKLKDNKLWIALRHEVKILREDMDSASSEVKFLSNGMNVCAAHDMSDCRQRERESDQKAHGFLQSNVQSHALDLKDQLRKGIEPGAWTFGGMTGRKPLLGLALDAKS